jgi:hypothetical protein
MWAAGSITCTTTRWSTTRRSIALASTGGAALACRRLPRREWRSVSGAWRHCRRKPNCGTKRWATARNSLPRMGAGQPWLRRRGVSKAGVKPRRLRPREKRREETPDRRRGSRTRAREHGQRCPLPGRNREQCRRAVRKRGLPYNGRSRRAPPRRPGQRSGRRGQRPEGGQGQGKSRRNVRSGAVPKFHYHSPKGARGRAGFRPEGSVENPLTAAGAKALIINGFLAARLKPCPDTRYERA